MNQDIKTILDKIEDNGYEAYVVGGYVRDFLLGIESVDVDICTNALPRDVIRIFDIKKENLSYGSISLSNGKYNFDITTYRKESNYFNRKPQSIEYTNNLILDIVRRDFTINTICMNKDGKIFDYLNGKYDLKNKLIKVVGDTSQRLLEDPLRILRALRFSIVLNFKLDDEIIKFIKENKHLISSLSYTRKKEELDKILSNKNAIYGLKILKELDLCNVLGIQYDKIVFVNDLLGMWAQIDFVKDYPFTKNNLKIINNIRYILKNKKIDNKILFNYDLYTTTVAGTIMGLNPKKINKMQRILPIKSKNELEITSKQIIEILNITNGLSIIEDDLIDNILNHKLVNNYDKIKKYLLKNWK